VAMDTEANTFKGFDLTPYEGRAGHRVGIHEVSNIHD
jgi:hypothetical protein